MRVRRSGGFTYLGVLFFIALAGVALAVVGVVWSTATQREREAQLLFVGDEIRVAIMRYYVRTPGTRREYPRTLEDLVRDPRYLTVERHLRKLYVDPFTGRVDWVLILTSDGRIRGVHSSSERRPLKIARFSPADAEFAGAAHYSEWMFASTLDEIPIVTAPVVPLVAPAAGAK